MFYFGLDIVNQNMYAWLGRWYTYQGIIGGGREARSDHGHILWDCGRCFTKYGFV